MAKRRTRDRAAELAADLTRTAIERGLADTMTAPDFFRRMFAAIDECLGERKREEKEEEADDDEDDD